MGCCKQCRASYWTFSAPISEEFTFVIDWAALPNWVKMISCMNLIIVINALIEEDVSVSAQGAKIKVTNAFLGWPLWVKSHRCLGLFTLLFYRICLFQGMWDNAARPNTCSAGNWGWHGIVIHSITSQLQLSILEERKRNPHGNCRTGLSFLIQFRVGNWNMRFIWVTQNLSFNGSGRISKKY